MSLISKIFGSNDVVTNGHATRDDSMAVETQSLASLMGGLFFYDLVKCGTCGVNWRDHSPECCCHWNREKRMQLFDIAKNDPAYARDMRNVIANGGYQ